MNNKFLKLASVFVAIVVMLCSFASAASIDSFVIDESRSRIDMEVHYADDATLGLYVAYAAKSVDAASADVVIDGAGYDLGTIISIFQAENETFLKLVNHGEPVDPTLVDITKYDHVVLRAGDNGAASTTAAAYAYPIPGAGNTQPNYTTTVQDATYNGIAAKVVRVAGLDTSVVVTVDGVTAKYYTKTDGTTVHVACIPAAGDATAISVATGTPALMIYGDVNATVGVAATDITEYGRRFAGYERTVPSYMKYELPTDLMSLMAYDVSGDGKITASDMTELKRSFAGYERTVPSYMKYTLETMGAYKK